MNLDWQQIIHHFQDYPPRVHKLLPPCNEERLETIQTELGTMPDELIDMLKHFNGARLFKKSGPLVSIFGISIIPALPPLEWATDWYIDKFTPKWRAVGEGRENDWTIGMMNYGGLIILNQDGVVREWDTAQKVWDPLTLEFGEWVEKILREGDIFMRED